MWSGIGARPTQQWLSISLLDEVALHHGFPTQGAVDFDLKIDLEAAEKRLGEPGSKSPAQRILPTCSMPESTWSSTSFSFRWSATSAPSAT